MPIILNDIELVNSAGVYYSYTLAEFDLAVAPRNLLHRLCKVRRQQSFGSSQVGPGCSTSQYHAFAYNGHDSTPLPGLEIEYCDKFPALHLARKRNPWRKLMAPLRRVKQRALRGSLALMQGSVRIIWAHTGDGFQTSFPEQDS